ncbi:MAG: site-specific DNA-methyltransferase [Methanomicrobiales archaeon]|nr:site-specific DNA-methyltransferase [Methanomicrobiales archaeon]
MEDCFPEIPLPAAAGSRDWVEAGSVRIPRVTGEFWTSRQRKASPIHEISYRACFKPQLPRFFISGMTREGDCVYDPFSGRGTTVLEAGLLARKVIANDTNPLSRILTRPRFFPPDESEVRERLFAIPLIPGAKGEIDLSMFYHRDTEAEIISLRSYLIDREESGDEDALDAWIRMVATNRLTGHSSGFFSVYTLPPNQAVSPGRQELINQRRNQVPPYRDVRELILRKTRSLVRGLGPHEKDLLKKAGEAGLFLTGDSRSTPAISGESVRLTVTSPPFLDTVQYAQDNWLRCWFNGIDAPGIEQNLTVTRSLGEWCGVMGGTFRELCRITCPGGYVAFEVGEVRKGRIRLDEHVVPLGAAAGFRPLAIMVNQQTFTKTSRIWGIGNNDSGTNTNRIVLFRKEE